MVNTNPLGPVDTDRLLSILVGQRPPEKTTLPITLTAEQRELLVAQVTDQVLNARPVIVAEEPKSTVFFTTPPIKKSLVK